MPTRRRGPPTGPRWPRASPRRPATSGGASSILRDCCATPVLSLAEAPQHPHNAARQTFIELDGITQPAPAPRFSRTRPAAPASPSLPGDHTRALLGELGLDTQAIRELEDAGVVAQSEKG